MMARRPFYNSISFRLPFALAAIGLLAAGVATTSIYGLMRAERELGRSGAEALESISEAARLSREVMDLVSSTSQAINIGSSIRLANESTSIAARVTTLGESLSNDKLGDAQSQTDIIRALEGVQRSTAIIAQEADMAQRQKEATLIHLAQLTHLRKQLPQFLAIDQIALAAVGAESLIKLGELRRAYLASPDRAHLSLEHALVHELLFGARQTYLMNQFALRASLVKLGKASRDLASATDRRSSIIGEHMASSFSGTLASLSQIKQMIILIFSLVLIISYVAAHYSVLRVSRGIKITARAMQRLAHGERDAPVPMFEGNENELQDLAVSFSRFKQAEGERERLDGMIRATHQLSHEVGNLIGIITGSLGLLREAGDLPPHQKRHLDRISRAAQRGKQMMKGMVSLASDTPQNMQTIDLRALILTAQDVLDMAVAPNCTIAIDLQNSPCPVLIEAAILEQALLNLCLNSAAAMPKGGVITIRLYQKKDKAVIEVSDTGTGMTPEVRARAFEPYFTTRGAAGGHGLGLSVVYNSIRQAGGMIHIEANHPTGTIVYLYLAKR